MSLQDNSSRPGTTISVVIVVGLFAVIIVCLIGIFITLNTLISQGSFTSRPAAQAGPADPSIMSGTPKTIRIGFDFSNQTPEDLSGDNSATSHLFIHRYPVPGAGFITGVMYLSDREPGGLSPLNAHLSEIPETVTLLILRPVSRGWKVIYNTPLPTDDNPPTTTGITTIKLEVPLPVEKGDIFAHWQPGKTGPIPLNYDDSSIDGLTAGQFGFSSSDLETGQVIGNGGFTGQRDYFINLIFEPAD